MDARQKTTVQPPTRWRTTRPGATRHRFGWRGALGVVSLMLFPAIAIPQGVAHSVGEMLRASVTNDWVQGEGFAPDASIDAWVTESDGVTVKGSATITSDGSGMFDVPRDQLGVDIVFGDVVFADDGVTQKDVTMTSPLSIDVVADPAFASGTLPAGADVIVYVRGSACEGSVSVVDGDNDGLWEYDFSASCPDGLGVFPAGEVNLHDGDGDATVAEPPPELRIGASPTDDWIAGSGFAVDSAVDIWVNTGPPDPPTMTAGTDYSGGFFTGAGMDLVFGDVVVASDGIDTRELTLAGPLSIAVAAGPPAGASGDLPLGSGIQVDVGGAECSAGAWVDDIDDGSNDGSWSVDFTAECPTGLGPDGEGQALHFDADADVTIVSMPQPPQIRASVTNNWVNGGGFEANASVDIWVNADPDLDPATGNAGTDSDGNFWWDSGLDLDFGDGVVVRDTLIERAVILTGPLSIEADFDARTANGALPTGGTVNVEMNGEDCGTGIEVADGDDGSVDGLWSADVSGDCPGGLGPNAGAQVALYDVDGDATVAEPPQPPQIRVSVTGDWMDGVGFLPNSPVEIWVNADPLLDPPTRVAGTDPGGNFHWGFDFDLVFGDEIVASDGVVERYLMLEGPLSIEADLDAMTAFGDLPIGAEVGVEMNGNECGTWVNVADGDDGADDGAWSVDASADCPGGLGGDAWARVLLHDADGDATMVDAPQPPQLWANPGYDWIQGFGFAPNGPVELWINADPLVDPPTDVVGTDGGGQFWFNPPVGLSFGDEIHASDGVIERHLVVEGPLSIEVDGPSATASGELPIGAGVNVGIGGNDCGAEAGVEDGDDGTVDGLWFVDVSGDCPGGLGDNAGGQVYLFDVDGDATVMEPPQPPQIQASLTNHWIQGWGFAPDSPVEVWINVDPLTDPATDIVGTDGGGHFDSFPPFPIGIGDEITASDGAIERYLLLEGPLSIEVDGPTATAWGELPVGYGAQVQIGGDACNPGGWVEDFWDGATDGLWSVDFSGDCPGGLGDNAGGQIMLPDADGDATVAEPPQPPQIRVSVTGDWMEGFGFLPNAPVEIWVNADPLLDPPTEVVGSDPGGNFHWGFDFDVMFGDEIIATDGVVERYLMLEGPLSIEADLDAMTAFGNLPIGAEVGVEMQGNECGTWVNVADGDDGDVDGTFSVDASADCPGGLGGDAGARVLLHDADGDATMVDAPQPPQIQASLTNHWIQGWGFAPDSPVEIWINVDPAGPPTDTVGIDGGGYFNYNPPFPIGVGDEITASDGVIERYLLLEGPLSIEIDGPSATAWGELPLGAGVAVGIGGNECGSDVEVEDGDDGAVDGLWFVDVSGGCPGGLGDNAGGQVSLFDVDGDATVAEPPQPPQIQASLTNHWIQGWGFAPDSSVEVWINVDPLTDPATDIVGTDGGGHFDSFPPFPIGIGDEITASDGAIDRYLLVEGPLSIEIDGASATAWGELPVGYGAQVEIGGSACGAGGWIEDSWDGATDGLWSVDFSGDCPGGLGDNAGGQIMLPDADGDATVAEPPQPPQIQASLTNHWIQGWGFSPDSPIEVWINVDPSGPPTDTVGTDSGGYFNYNPQFPIGVGDEITASDGATERYLLLEGPLSIVVDPASASASGGLPSGRGVQVQLNGPNCGSGAWIEDGFDGVDGLWSVDLSGDCPDGLGGDWGSNVQLFDSDGDATVAETSPAPHIASSVTHDWIEGYNLSPSTTVGVWVNGDQVATVVTGGGGSFYIESPSFGDANLVLGDLIEVDDGTTLKTLSLNGPMTIDVDASSAVASGELPLGARVFFSLFSSACGDFYNLEVDDGSDGSVDGLWALDLSPECPGGLGAGWDAQVDRYDSDGDATIVMWVLPGDTDGDGLSDADERNLYGTDWSNPDTDGDGLSDGDEVLIHGTVPLDPDTDQDGLLDGQEVTIATDPLDPDTDHDGLLDGAEVNTHLTDPKDADTDNDGLTDGAEVNTHKTNPNKADTDGGTVNDGIEIANGTDPLDPSDDVAILPPLPSLQSVVPARLLETRLGPNDLTVDHLFEHLGRQAARTTLELVVAGRGGVPADAEAVMLNLTAVVPSGPGFLTVFPCGSKLPVASHVNYGPGDIAPNAVLAKIGTDGKVCIYTLAETDLIADVNGYVPAGGSPSSVVPARLLETRLGPNDLTVDHLFEHLGRQAARTTLELVVAGRGGVPADAEAVMLNLTAVVPSGPGFLTVFPCGSKLPVASHVNYGPGDIAPNAVLAKIGTDGKVCIYTLAETDLIADVNGYVPAGGSPSSVVPARLLETRLGPNDLTVDHLFEHLGRQAARTTLELVVAGRGGVPADAEAVMLNLTAVVPSGPGFLTVFPCGSKLPVASHVNYGPGDIAPNAVLAKIGTDGKVCIYTLAETDLIADVNGYV